MPAAAAAAAATRRRAAALRAEVAEKDRALRYVENELLSMRELFNKKEQETQAKHRSEVDQLHLRCKDLETTQEKQNGLVASLKEELAKIRASESRSRSELQGCKQLLAKAEAEIQLHESDGKRIKEEHFKLQEKLKAMGAIFRQMT
mmetsp:Transcript_31310/g.54057  ORF Transcript_31310/g.54057 Transcript_31310/m.54057 type:complete len:147 (-) Transcript_31310:98-538(-)